MDVMMLCAFHALYLQNLLRIYNRAWQQNISSVSVIKQSTCTGLLGDTVYLCNFNGVLLMPRLQKHHLLLNVSHCASVLQEVSRWNSCPSSLGKRGVLWRQKLRVRRLPSARVFSKLISLHPQNQERQTEALGYPSQTWVAFTDFHPDLGHAIWD